MEWAQRFFGAGVLPEDLEKALSAQQRQRMGSGALLDAGIAMLANSGYSSMPQSLGQILGQGLGAGRQSVAAQGAQAQEALARQQAMEQQQAQAQQWQQMLQSLPPEQQELYRLFTPQEGAKALAEQSGRERIERLKIEGRGPEMSSYAKTARDMGLTPGTPEFQEMVTRLATQSKAPVVNVNAGQVSPFSRAMASKDADTFAVWRDKAMAAGDTLQALDALQQINRLQQGGKIGEAQAYIGQVFGTDAAANMQTFNAVAQELVLTQASKLSGVISDRDMMTLQETLPRFGNDPRANEVIIGILRRASEKAIKNHEAADKYVTERGDLRGFRPLISLPTPAPSPIASGVDMSKLSDDELLRALGGR